MLHEIAMQTAPEEEVLKAELRAEREQLSKNQNRIKDAGLPVMVVFEGWGAAGKGSIIGKVIKNIDPRFFRVSTMEKKPSEEEKRYPFLYRYLLKIPEAGKFAFFDTYWMEEVVQESMLGHLNEEQYRKRIDCINRTERSLHDNGYLILKFFFQISKKEQKRRLKALEEDKNAAWRVNKLDKEENDH